MSEAGSTRRILIIEDDRGFAQVLQTVISRMGQDAGVVHTGHEALRAVQDHRPDSVLLDLGLPDMSGMQLLEKFRALAPGLPVIVITGRTEVNTAVQAMRSGAFDYLVKPIENEEIVFAVRRALERQALQDEVQKLRRRTGPEASLLELLGPGVEARRVAAQVSLVAPSDLTVLILGETGTGKEVVTRALHRESARHDRPLVALDCGAIPDALMESELFGHEKGAFTGADRRRTGHFQAANGGTLFLDEVGNLPSPLQPKLLRVLESREVTPVGASRPEALDVRIIAATNTDLAQRSRERKFREDLYFRLAQFIIHLPPLRKRADDIPHLVQLFQQEACLELRRPVCEVTPRALEFLQQRPWPGNVRELRNVIRQAVLRLSGLAIDEHILRDILQGTPAAAQAHSAPPLDETPAKGSLREIADAAAQAAERAAITAALRTAGGNKTAAARLLKTDFKTLHLKIRRYGITVQPLESESR